MSSGRFLYGTYVFLSSVNLFLIVGLPVVVMKDLSSASVYCAVLLAGAAQVICAGGGHDMP